MEQLRRGLRRGQTHAAHAVGFRRHVVRDRVLTLALHYVHPATGRVSRAVHDQFSTDPRRAFSQRCDGTVRCNRSHRGIAFYAPRQQRSVYLRGDSRLDTRALPNWKNDIFLRELDNDGHSLVRIFVPGHGLHTGIIAPAPNRDCHDIFFIFDREQIVLLLRQFDAVIDNTYTVSPADELLHRDRRIRQALV